MISGARYQRVVMWVDNRLFSIFRLSLVSYSCLASNYLALWQLSAATWIYLCFSPMMHSPVERKLPVPRVISTESAAWPSWSYSWNPSIDLANPKSQILTVQSLLSNILPGLRSRWTTLRSWRFLRPVKMFHRINFICVRSSSILLFTSLLRSVWQWSITK